MDLTSQLKIILDAETPATEKVKQVEAALEGTEEAARKSSEGLDKTSLSLTDLKSGLDLAKDAANAAGQVFVQAFEMGKEGATIIATTDSLTRMAEEAGYAGDLIGDLETAAGGTVDDLDYMGSALKVLANTTGDWQSQMADSLPTLLEISRATVKLNPTLGSAADVFNALTQAIQTGQTRGLKPYGFQIDATASSQEQLNQIMAQGQGLIDKLGGNVESAVDPFNRLENSVDNLKDTILTGLAPALTAAAEGANTLLTWQSQLDTAMADHNQEVADTSETYTDYVAEMQRAAEAAGMQLVVTDELTEAEGKTMGAVIGLTEAQWVANQATLTAEEYGSKLANTATEYLIPSQEDAALAAEKVALAHQNEATAFAQANTQSTLLKDAIGNLVEGYDPAITAAGLLRDGINAITDSAVEAERVTLLFAIAQKTAELASRDLTDAEKAQASAELELMLNQQTELENMDTLNQLAADGTITRYDWIAAMADQIVTTEELNALMGVENETVAENEEAMFLAEQAARKQTDAQQGIVDQAPTTISALNDLAIAADAASGDYSIHFNVTTSGTIPSVGGGGAPTGGSGSGSSQGFAGGADFIVPPGYPNDSYGPIYVQSGERVQVTPAGEVGQGGNGVTIQNLNIYANSNDPVAIARQVGQELGRMVRLDKYSGVSRA